MITSLKINSQTSGLNLNGLFAVDQSDQPDELSTDLVTNHVLTTGIKDKREETQQPVQVGAQDLRLSGEEVEDRLEHWPILEEIVLQWESTEEGGQNLVKRESASVSCNESCNGTDGVISCRPAGIGRALGNVEDLDVLLEERTI